MLKEYRAQLAWHLRDAGVPLETFIKASNKTRFTMSKRSLQTHVAAVGKGESPFKREKRSGRPSKLSEEQWRIVSGAILLCEKAVGLRWVCDFVAAYFGISIDAATASRHLQSLDLSRQLTGSRPLPKTTTRDKYVKTYYDFLLHLRDTSFFEWDESKIVCVDCCFNSYRLERTKTFQLAGQSQKNISSAKPLYTNCYLCAVCYDDDFQFPPIMFTHDPVFDPDGNRAEEVQTWCDNCGIDRDCIVYEESDKKYHAEGADVISHFQRVHRKELSRARILHDDGNAFKIDGDLILEAHNLEDLQAANQNGGQRDRQQEGERDLA
jgi:transposase